MNTVFLKLVSIFIVIIGVLTLYWILDKIINIIDIILYGIIYRLYERQSALKRMRSMDFRSLEAKKDCIQTNM